MFSSRAGQDGWMEIKRGGGREGEREETKDGRRKEG